MMKRLASNILASCLVLLGSCEGHGGHQTAYQVLKAEGFGEENILFCQIGDGKVVKNVNKEISALLEALKNSSIVDGVFPTPAYTIEIEKGSSSSSELITIYVAVSGDGLVLLHGRKPVRFHCPSLPSFCATAFNGSNTVLAQPVAAPDANTGRR
jgi:hypothetical protein